MLSNHIQILATLQTVARDTKQQRAKKAHYFAVQIAWLDCPEDSRLDRLQLIQRASRADTAALRALDEITRLWQSKHGTRSRYGSVQRSHIDSVCNGSAEVFGCARSGWQRFASWVALRAITSSKRYQAARASIKHVAALAHGMPTVAAAIANGVDLTANHGAYRRTQRALRMFAAHNMVKQWRASGWRTNWYSYRLSTPHIPEAIVTAQAQRKRNIAIVKTLIADVESQRALTASEAAEVYGKVKPSGWHDIALVPEAMRTSIAPNIKYSKTVGGRQYVRLTLCSPTELRQAENLLLSTVGGYVMRC